MRKLLVVMLGIVMMLTLLSAATPVAAQTIDLNWPSESRFAPTAQLALVDWPSESRFAPIAQLALVDWPSESRFAPIAQLALAQ